ncbi:MAG: Uma2 family endonuclease [Deinococcales bacterium]
MISKDIYPETELDLEDSLEGEDSLWEDVRSLSHSYYQARLAAFFVNQATSYLALVELSLDISQFDLSVYHLKLKGEVRPDVCLYKARALDPLNDILKMTEVPLMVAEILSPMQPMRNFTEKFRLYFDLGVKSCWLVTPFTKSISVYYPPNKVQTFATGELYDPILEIRLDIDKFFS